MTGNMLIHDGAGAVPTTAQLSTKQVGVNTADATIFVNNGSGIVEVGSPGWITACQTKAQFESARAASRREHPASGFHDFGTHYGADGVVAQGLNTWTSAFGTSASAQNSMWMGRDTGISVLGDSATSFGRTLISGVIHDLYRVDTNEVRNVRIELPPAPDGRTVHNIATGASVRHDSAPEAFEGLISNGDFRNGTTGWTGHGGSISFNNGRLTMIASSASPMLTQMIPTVVNSVYVLTFYGADGLNGRNVRAVAGTSLGSDNLGTGANEVGQRATLRFRATTTTTHIALQGRSFTPGISMIATSAECRLADEEVVIRRSDIFGGEYFLREVTKGDPWVYPKGCIQSNAATMNSVPTVVASMPDSYYSVYAGHIINTRKGVNFWDASGPQKVSIVSDPSNNIYYNEGKVYQFCMRIRSIAGIGNGDWSNIDAGAQAEYGGSFLVFHSAGSANSFVQAQGNRHSSAIFAGAQRGYTNNYNNKYPSSKASRGIFAIPGLDSTTCVDGECYFHVWGVVPRLNQGAYHPSYNPFGTALMRTSGGSWLQWHRSELTNAHSSHSASSCFRGMPYNVGGSISNSTAAHGGSGRSDGRYHDAIYVSGLGGVNDFRMSCKDVGTYEHVADKVLDAMSGKYPGMERLPLSKFGLQTASSHSGTQGFECSSIERPEVGDTVYLQNTNGTYRKSVVSGLSSDGFTTSDTGQRVADSPFVVISREDTTVSGLFTMTDIIGNPNNLRQVFPLGFLGEWTPNVPNGTIDLFAFNRPRHNTSSQSAETLSSPTGTWSVITAGLHSDRNEATLTNLGASVMCLMHYDSLTKTTKPVPHHPVLHGDAGIGNVIYSSYYRDSYGRSLGYSLTGRIGTSSSAESRGGSNITSASIDPVNKTFNNHSAYRPTHHGIRLGTPSNNGRGYKALWSTIKYQSYANIQFNYGELRHNGASWGDDGDIHVYGHDSSHQNTNGDTVKAGTHTLIKPLGYTW